MNKTNQIEETLLFQVANMTGLPRDAYNIRKNGGLSARSSTKNITIKSKTDKSGIDIFIRPGTRGESVHIPVIITESGLEELVYNDFYIGENCDVDIIAGCGIHNDGHNRSQHDGLHTFHVGKNSKIRYNEKHYGEGNGSGERIMNPKTVVYLEEGAFIQMDMVQIRGVDSTKRYTKVEVGKNAEAVLAERLLTQGKQTAVSEMDVFLNGAGSASRIISRSVAQDESSQTFYPRMIGNASGFGHVQCDSILMGHAKIRSIPAITANNPNAQLVHEAAIGRIAGDQLLKLMTLGLTEQEAEEKILSGFLK
ncbi:MAG: SufD family Fe-S cluster assembly protein [Oscillospiraceae bacterium]|nr:SufD family Fe-S cluster assembly protein [Oscillospiraceae bacterium]